MANKIFPIACLFGER